MNKNAQSQVESKESTVNAKETQSQQAQDVEIMANESISATPAKDASEMIQDAITDAVIPKNEVLIMGNTVCMNSLLKKLFDARNDAGRMEAICFEKGIVSKRKIKSVQGTGISFVDLSSITQAAKLGLIAGKPEKVKARVDAIKGMNMLIDALCLLGMADRQEEY